MADNTWMALMIIVVIILLFLVGIFWDGVKSIFVVAGAVIMWPYARWRRKKAEKAFMEHIKEHQAEFIEELMKQVKNEALGQQISKEEEKKNGENTK